jgi:hypothetical protein
LTTTVLRIDKFTTLFLYTLRLIYEEEREKINNYRNVRTETQAVVEKMYSFGLLPGGKTTIKERIEAQRTLAHHNIIQKIEGKWEPDGNHLIVFPSILHIVSVQGINDMLQELEDMRVQPVQEEGTDEEAADELKLMKKLLLIHCIILPMNSSSLIKLIS